MSSENDTKIPLFLKEFLRRYNGTVDVDKDSLVIKVDPAPCIPVEIWKQIPEHAIQILEEAGYTKYDRKTDSIVFVQK